MAKRIRRKKPDATKNRKLGEFLSQLEIAEEQKEQIMEFVEKLTFEKIKEASVKRKQTKPELRLKR